MLFILGGLPAVGKTSIAKALAKKLSAVHLRIDTIEQSLINTSSCTKESMHDKGYSIAYALAQDNLHLGLSVVADSVNPIEETRYAWREAALSSGVPYLEIEIICSDRQEHQRRAENRTSDIPCLSLPSWENIQSREFEVWSGRQLIIDTSQVSITEALAQITNHLEKLSQA